MNAEAANVQKWFGGQLATWATLFLGLLAAGLQTALANWETEVPLSIFTVPLKHNRPEVLTKEINSFEVQCALAGVTNPVALPLGLLETRLAVKETLSLADSTSSANSPAAGKGAWEGSDDGAPHLGICRLEWSTAKAREKVPENVQQKLKIYLEERLRGHTKEYLLASIREKSLRPARLDPHVAWIRKEYPDVPVSWIKKSVFHTYEQPKTGCYQVVDGPLAWIYYTDLQKGTAFLLDVVDAQEVNEETRDAVRQAGEEANRILAERGVKRTLGYVHSFWPEKKRILREKHGIHWRSPGELNSGIFD